MPRETLLDFFDDLSKSAATFLVYDDGFRTRRWRYDEVSRSAEAFARQLEADGVARGDRVILWGENRPEWIVAFWSCVLRGAVAVPIDFRASTEFLSRVRAIVDARLVLVGDDVGAIPEGTLPGDVRVRRLGEIEPPAHEGAAAKEATPPRRDVQPDPGDVVEIIFTSGATAEPRGVLITHRNILANIVPIEREIAKYRKYGRPFRPIRFLNLLPLSHMFGQAMATFVPPMLPGEVVFMRGLNPVEIVRQIKTRRISVLVSVPKILDVLREYISRTHPDAADPDAGKRHWLWRWWRSRAVHRELGWKFWAAIVGAAPLDPALEQYWSRLGYLVVQGYGLTETAPIVTLNHPFHARQGSVGKPIAGVEVRIAEDGEILVRGDNVTTGYYRAPEATAEALQDGWLHTGDIGGIDESGQVYIRGRQKEMIVTPEGLNVFPEDVERVLLTQPGVRDAAVVGRTWEGEERVHAVLVAEPGTDPDLVVRAANKALGDHQKIRSASIWTGAELPRTEGTRKLRRREIRRVVEAGAVTDPVPTASGQRLSVEEIVARYAKGRGEIVSSTTLDEIGLSSIERVELLMELESRFESTIDEAAFAEAKTVADLIALIGQPAGDPGAVPTTPSTTPGTPGAPAERPAHRRVSEGGEDGPVVFPRWNRSWPARTIRRASLPTWILPLGRVFARLTVRGLEHLETLEGPVVFASNHQSHMDTPVLLSALPGRWRYRVAVAMAKEFFTAHFYPEKHGRRAWLFNSTNYYLATLFFNAFPLPQREAGTRQTLRYIGTLLEEGYSVLIFPEGKRTERGEINPFRPGIGMIASRLEVPIVPVRIQGVDQVLHQSWKMARPGPVTVTFGAPLVLNGDDYVQLTRTVENAVRQLA